MDEAEVRDVLNALVEQWIAQGSTGAVAIAMPSEAVTMLLATGYLTGDDNAKAGIAVAPTPEALNLTDPFLCEELASAFRWEFHRRFLAHLHGTATA